MERKEQDRGSFFDDVSSRAGEALEKGMLKGRVQRRAVQPVTVIMKDRR
jgi:hypothetical protein